MLHDETVDATGRAGAGGVAAMLAVLLCGVCVPAQGATGAPAAGSSLARAPGATTLAGTGVPGFSGDGRPAPDAQLDAPAGIAEDAAGDVFIADAGNCRVREIPARTGTAFGRHLRAGVITTLVGGPCGAAGTDPPPVALALDPQGDLFIGFAAAAKVDVLAAHSTTAFGLRLTAGKLTVVAGTGVPGYGGDGGSAVKAALDDPSGLAIDPAGDLLVADTANCRLRLVAASTGTRFGVSVVPGRIYTVAGDGFCGPYGDGGPARRAQLWDPGALAVNPAGDVLVADQGNRSIRLLAAATGNYYGVPLAADDLGTVAGEGSYGPYLADGLPALSEIGELNFPTGVAVGANGDLYVADGDMHAIRVVPATQTTVRGLVAKPDDMYTVAGALSVGSLRNRTMWIQTTLRDPTGLALAPDGQLVYSDTGADVVRELPTGA